MKPPPLKHPSSRLSAAIGTGIANGIHAVADEIETPASWVHLCTTAADEAYDEVMRNPPLKQSATAENRSVHERYLEELEERYADQLPKLVPDKGPASEYLHGAALEAAAHMAASVAFRCTMPHPTSRRRTQAYIACIAAGSLAKYLTGQEANALLYAAQSALSAYPNRRKTERKPTK